MMFRLLAAGFALLTTSCLAQTATKVVEPEAIGVIFNLAPDTQELKRLPSEDWKKHSSPSLFSATMQVKIAGTASSFRIAGGDKATFVFAGVGGDVMEVKLFACAVKSGRRQYDLGKYKDNLANYKRPTYIDNTGEVVTISKYGASSFKLTPDKPLGPGEYAILFGDKLFTFGVDAATK